MKRFALMLFITINAVNASATENYQDWWWSAALDGMGLNVGQQGDTIVVSWYHYDEGENPTFLLFHGPLIGNVVEGDLWRSFGPPPGPDYDPAVVDSLIVGSASLTFSASDQAILSYDFNGRSGAFPLQRYTYAIINGSGDWHAIQTGVYSNCTLPELNGSFLETTSLSITQEASVLTVTEEYETGETCVYRLAGIQKGSYVDASGRFTCDYGLAGTAQLSNIRVIDDFLTFSGDLQLTSGETCRIQGNVAATRW